MSGRTTVAHECPDAELLAGFVEDRLDAGTRSLMEQHVSGCADCLDVVAACLPIESANPPERRVVDALPLPAMSARIERRRQLRGALAAGLVLATTAVVAYAGTRLVTVALARVVASRATAAVRMPVGVGNVGIALSWSARRLTVRFDDVRIGAKSDAFASDALEVSMALSALIDRVPIPERIRLVGPHIRVPVRTRTDRGDRSSSSPLDQITALGVSVPLELTGGVVVLDDEEGGGELRIDDVRGTVTPSATTIAVDLAGTMAAGTVVATGSVDLTAAGALNLTVQADGLRRESLPTFADLIDAHGNLDVRIGGTIAAPLARKKDA